MTWHWQCVDLGANKTFGRDYVIIAKNAAGMNVTRPFTYNEHLTSWDDMIFHIGGFIASMEREIAGFKA